MGLKFNIMGFSQREALKLQKNIIEKVKNKKTGTIEEKSKVLKLDLTDLFILRWIVDFYPSDKMVKIEVNGERYFHISYKGLLDQCPILDIGKDMLYRRLRKMCELKVLKCYTHKESGTFSYYAFGENYIRLINESEEDESEGTEKIPEGYGKNSGGGTEKIPEGYGKNSGTNNSSINNSSINNSSINNNIKAPSDKIEQEQVEKTFIEIPLNDNTNYQFSVSLLEEYKGLYPAADVKQELRNYKAWTISNPTKRKTRRGILTSINSWLSKAQNQGRGLKNNQNSDDTSYDLDKYEKENRYLDPYSTNY